MILLVLLGMTVSGFLFYIIGHNVGVNSYKKQIMYSIINSKHFEEEMEINMKNIGDFILKGLSE